MTLPVTLNDFGDPITIRHASPEELQGALGQYVTETGEILIRTGQTPAEETNIIIHEVIHLWEQQALGMGIIKKDLPEEFIGGLACGLLMLLTRAGVIPEMEGFEDFMQGYSRCHEEGDGQ